MCSSDLRLEGQAGGGDEAAVGEPHAVNYADNLQFFTDVVTQLEAWSVRADRLVEERSRALLGRAFSRVFSHLRNMDPHFDFNAAIAQSPRPSETTWRTGWKTMWMLLSGPLLQTTTA